ncbi:single-stranded-DNA-specific exonuclease RecJ [Streptococcus macacae]|uniref:Single-stranded-DNA-specific exonuclease RecJ n=1 Tax=Streptococcus macacae NCTC 11558 TaxID=764298 RepID=G5JVP6_9STRE|nr:single-stranded-DNA-specific exonuclease RecJ [Streptococcus macacae]EHJ51694.1 single-stranded-DNA-specific exonuclease RecJ [Streptococcus macacae NCTC 11558]SUN78713.1 single-stranded-DNA-specific exonuclease RecJ [Streptococcus macacae NCTC 11558]
MITSKFNWKINQEKPDDGFFERTEKAGLHAAAAKILYKRGIKTSKDVEAFLNPQLSMLHDPFLLNDMQKAVDRIRRAIENEEHILIYGDYDADGMTSGAIAKEALEILGAQVSVYLPNRFTDGYGPNQSIYQYFIEQQHVSLIITVDNGVAGKEAIAYAQKEGVDVIVTDHHSMPAELPQAYALIHPEHPKASYPFPFLAGCGVAFKLACALLESVPTEMLDLVAIGTIADMVSLTDENRVMVKFGLEILKQTERIGLQELLEAAGVDWDSIDEETIAFKLAPQLNALGRLDDPNPAIELLTGFDDEEAHKIAAMINEKNEERKVIVQTIFDEAMAMVDLEKPAQVLAKEGWHAGVLGIVAGRIMEEVCQPVIVLNIENGLAKGSARSPESVNIFEALNEHREELFTAFGGHAGAAGMTLKTEKLAELSSILDHYVQAHGIDLSQKPTLVMDEELFLPELNLDRLKDLEKLSPFGMDNKKPVFFLKNVTVKQARTMGQNGAHLKLKIAQEKAEFDLLAFHKGSLAAEFQQAQHLELAVTLSVNRWNGNTSLQLILIDARVEGIQLIDIRARSSSLPEGVPLLSAETDSKAVILSEIPEQAEELLALFKNRDFEAIYFKNTIKNQYYLTGYGTHEQFAKLYKTVCQYPQFDVRYKLKELSQYLQIPEILLIKMIQIFDELNFVSIEDGVMTVNKAAKKRDISESHIYQDLKKLVKFQELMALGTPQEIYHFLTDQGDRKKH